MKDANYSKWASFFKPMCGKFGMKPHINGTSLQQLTTDPLWPFWDPADCCIRSYIYGSVGNTVLNLTMEGDEWLFRTNKEPRAIFLHHEFHSMEQGDAIITEYC